MIPTAALHPLSPARERWLLWLLALTQFTVIMDFMVMMPLAPQLMRAFSVSPAAVSGAVSVYAWCAGLSGLFAATYIDRFDRKRLLLTIFCLFSLSNVACALAPSFSILLITRAFAGLTGGVLGAMTMAIIGDVIPPARRGAATGIVMTSFSLAAVAGVPIGVLLGAHTGWQAPFCLLALVSLPILAGAARVLPSLRAHLSGRPTPLAQVLPGLFALFRVPRHLLAFLLSGGNMMVGMLVIPFISPVLVGNLGIAPGDITWIYLAGGCATLFSARWIGRCADRYGKHAVYRWVAGLSIMPILVVTHLPLVPLAALIVFFPFFMMAMSGRNIPLQALLTTIPDPARRGAFLSANSSMQQLGTGLGAWVGGLLLTSDTAGHIAGYGRNGWLATGLTLCMLLLVGQVRGAEGQPAPQPLKA